MNVLSLFSGIGGLDLAAEAAGMRVVTQVEIDPFCRRVLAKHWPQVRCYEDIHDVTGDRLRADGIPWPALICGGFPCQDISAAGKGAGIELGARSGLWREFARLIGDIRPRYVVVENVAALLHRGLDRVCGDLAALGYDATWATYGADAVGAPHRRERVFIVGHLVHPGSIMDRRPGHDEAGDVDSAAREAGRRGEAAIWRPAPCAGGAPVAHASGERPRTGRPGRPQEREEAALGSAAELAHAEQRQGGERHDADVFGGRTEPAQLVGLGGGRDRGGHAELADADAGRRDGWPREQRAGRWAEPASAGSGVGLVADTAGNGWQQGRAEPAWEQGRPDAAERGAEGDGNNGSGSDRRGGVADAHGEPLGRPAEPWAQRGERVAESGVGQHVARISTGLVRRGLDDWPGWPARPGQEQHDWEPPRLATGVKQRVAKLKALGNAVVPAQAYPIFAAITQAEDRETA